jgi:hypothetical protein
MKIHIHSRYGLYTVVDYDTKYINLMTKHYKFTVPVSDFKSFAGGHWNLGVTEEEQKQFLSAIKHEELKSGVRKFLDKLFTRQVEEPKVEVFKKTYHDDELPF